MIRSALTLGRRTLIVIVAVLAIHALVGCKTTRPVVAPSVVAITGKVAQAQTSIDAAREHAGRARKAIARAEAVAPVTIPELGEALQVARQEIDQLTHELLVAQEALKSATAKAADLQKQITAQAEQLNAAIAQRDDAVSNYRWLKFWCCVIGAAAVVLLLSKFKRLLAFIPPPYNLAAFLAAPAITFGLLWVIL